MFFLVPWILLASAMFLLWSDFGFGASLIPKTGAYLLVSLIVFVLLWRHHSEYQNLKFGPENSEDS
jgi:glycerol-3-phosphate acyltransferase PlsY